jgi:AraC-like DNA-binding protein
MTTTNNNIMNDIISKINNAVNRVVKYNMSRIYPNYSSNYGNRRPSYNWDGVDWKEQDIVIARKMGATRERVRQKRIELGIPKSPRHRCHHTLYKQKLIKMKTSRLTVGEISKEVGCNKQYVRQILKELGKSYIKSYGKFRKGGKDEDTVVEKQYDIRRNVDVAGRNKGNNKTINSTIDGVMA